MGTGRVVYRIPMIPGMIHSYQTVKPIHMRGHANTSSACQVRSTICFTWPWRWIVRRHVSTAPRNHGRSFAGSVLVHLHDAPTQATHTCCIFTCSFSYTTAGNLIEARWSFDPPAPNCCSTTPRFGLVFASARMDSTTSAPLFLSSVSA